MKDLELEQIFVYLIERTERQMKKYAAAVLKKAGIEISSDQWLILKKISEQDSLNQRELAELVFKDPASVTRTLDLLEQSGLLKRGAVENDRRAYNLYLTDEGQALVEKVTPLAQSIRAQGLKNIDTIELEQFKSTLNKIFANYS